MNYILFDDNQATELYPFTMTRAVADILCGIFTMRERWSHFLNANVHILTNASLQSLYPLEYQNDDTIYINAAFFANMPLTEEILALERNEVLLNAQQEVIAIRVATPLENIDELYNVIASAIPKLYTQETYSIRKPWDIFKLNDFAIRSDFDVIQVQSYSQKLPDYVTVVGSKEDIFVAPGAILSPCILNVTSGPIYIGEEAEIMDGAIVRGPFALKSHGVLKMGAKVYGATTIGEGSKVGGEVNNIVVFNNSNKGHDGFLGNAVVGEWCNLGADTNCSNLKNNYDEVKVWNIKKGALERTGLQFCGLLMGDHSKCGINTMFNTGTVVGVSANIFGAGFPDKYIPSFTWGGVEKSTIYKFDKACETANRMMARRGKQLSEAEITILQTIYQQEINN
jgi:UDP-N-acetylglucosamine diphosphorylase/glucosamine-1-phosphate N-acetyltransferase